MCFFPSLWSAFTFHICTSPASLSLPCSQQPCPIWTAATNGPYSLWGLGSWAGPADFSCREEEEEEPDCCGMGLYCWLSESVFFLEISFIRINSPAVTNRRTLVVNFVCRTWILIHFWFWSFSLRRFFVAVFCLNAENQISTLANLHGGLWSSSVGRRSLQFKHQNYVTEALIVFVERFYFQMSDFMSFQLRGHINQMLFCFHFRAITLSSNTPVGGAFSVRQ